MIRLEQRGEIAVVVLARPAQRNALTPEMLSDLADVPGAVGSARALMLAGEGKVFCAGFDLDLCRAHPDGSAMRALLWGLSRAIVSLRRLDIPVVAAAHSAAIAGACALLGAADLVVADRRARLGYPVVRLGVSPAVSAPFLSPAIGVGAARTRLLDPGLVSGEEAACLGLVHHVVESPGEVLQAAAELAGDLASKPPGAVRATKAWLRELSAVDPEPGLLASLSLAGSQEETGRLDAAR